MSYQVGQVVYETEKGEKVELVLDLGNGMWIAKAHINALKEQDMNARAMSKSMFERLRDNIKAHKGLESLPYCALTEKYVEIVSGHHRVRGCRAAEIFEIHIILDTNKLSRGEIVARQLAHNAISGVDDKDMLQKLFLSIEDVDLRLETYINPEDLGIEIDTTASIMDIHPDVEFKNVNIIFLPHQFDQFTRVIERLKGDESGVYLADSQLFEVFKQTIQSVQDSQQIKSISMALAKMCEIVEANLPKKEEEEATVPPA